MKNHDNDFRVTWEVADGYVGRDRPQHFHISKNDLAGDEDENTLRRFFGDTLQEEFEQRVGPTSEDEDAFVEWAKAVLEELKDEE